MQNTGTTAPQDHTKDSKAKRINIFTKFLKTSQSPDSTDVKPLFYLL